MTLLGQISLYLWAVVAMALFARLSARVAIAVTIIGGYLLLPTRAELDLPLLPALNKDTVPVLMAILLLAVTASDRTGVRPGVVPRHWLALVLMMVMVVGAFGTVMTNGDLLQYGPTVLRALRPYDAFSEVLTVVMLLLPMLIGRKYFARPEDHRLLLQVLMVAGLGYSLLALYEIRMSPQLNRIFYGYFPHSWVQHIRGNGFRPLVFLDHGLWLSLFLSGTTLAAVGLWRTEADAARRLADALGAPA